MNIKNASGIIAIVALIVILSVYLLNDDFQTDQDSSLDEDCEIFCPWDDESPIKSTFTKTKLIWRMDDYNAGLSKNHPLNIGFHRYAENITKHGGQVLISVIPNTWNIHDKLEFFEYNNKNFVSENLELYNLEGVDFALHGWNHDCESEPWKSSYSEQYHRFNISRETLEKNLQIELKWFCTPCCKFNLNTTKVLFKENFYNSNFIKNSHSKCLKLDETFYIDNNTWSDPENLSESKNRWNNTELGTDNITQILFHPNRLTDKNLDDFSQFCDWLYSNHDIWNVNWSEALQFKLNEDKISIKKLGSNKYIIDLNNTVGMVSIIWCELGSWEVLDTTDNSLICTIDNKNNDNILYLHSNKHYLFRKINL